MRSWQWMASGAALGFIIHSAMLLHIPDNYTSVARLNYSSSGPQQAVGREVLHLADSALSDNEVARIMARHGLYGNLRAEGRGNEAAAWFRRDLRFSTREAETTGHGSVLRVAYSDADPERAQKVARDVITLVIDENLRVHAARFPHDAVVNQEDARWKGTTLGVLDLPNRPAQSNRWANAPWTIGSGVLAGLGLGLIAAVVQMGWLRLRV